MVPGGPLPAGAVAVLAHRPAAGPAPAFLQLLPGPPNAALSRVVACLASSTQQMNSPRRRRTSVHFGGWAPDASSLRA